LYSLEKIAEILGGKVFGDGSLEIKHIYTDTRKIQEKKNALFFAITSDKDDGHNYISQACNIGIKVFVVTKKPAIECSYILVKNSLQALHQLTKKHRENFQIPIIGITGSNGKTIIKEWVSHLLKESYVICKSPKSYNSQIGVPLSIWQLNDAHSIGIFEAGISKYDEMSHIANIIQPEIGIFTYLGDAHGNNFKSRRDKLLEKLKLFKNSKIVICSNTQKDVVNEIRRASIKLFTWGFEPSSNVLINHINDDLYHVQYQDEKVQLSLPFSDKASIHNTFTSIATALYIGENLKSIGKKIKALPNIDMRLQHVKGVYNSQLILDYYNADYQSITMAIDFLNQQKIEGQKCSIILSDILESYFKGKKLYKKINALLSNNKVHELIGIGENIEKHKEHFSIKSKFYSSTEMFLEKHPMHLLKNQMVLIKGARKFKFEKITEHLKLKTHQTALHVNLSRLQHNVNIIKNKIGPETKIMTMVKALAYGSGGYQIAKLLEYNNVDFLGVAYTDEATRLKRAGISTPIIVLSPDLTDLTPYTETNIQPVIYNISSLQKVKNLNISIHIEFDTGMHRLGFERKDLDKVVATLSNKSNINVVSIFSHLAGADNQSLDYLTKKQIEEFEKISLEFEKKSKLNPIRHLSNSAGIFRFPKAKMDMVRSGLSLYGISPVENQSKLLPVNCFKSYITQIRHIPAGEGIGYGHLDKVNYDRKIAVVAVGYADGYSRSFSCGKGSMLINGQFARVVGNVCMDMTMCDVTAISCKEKEEVIIFGDHPTVEDLSKQIDTIPYEILTNISERVSRIFFQE
tara:strand:+ start:24054 stop:26459 length:2406 start_codon:yes stop_codon:yes gene_type:complete